MSTVSTVDVADVRPLRRPETVALAAAETARTVALLRSLRPDEWTVPTDCPLWDVRALAGHVLGATETFTSLPRLLRVMATANRTQGDGLFIDAMTAVQVRATAGLTTAELLDRLDAAGPRQARWRGRRTPLRRLPVPGELRDGTVETWHLADLLDTILTRDTWMHRMDVATATDRAPHLTAEHDGRIVADVVAEWARRHGEPFRLELTGPAGGRFTSGAGGPEIMLDAVTFCRTLAGRVPGEGLLAREVPF